MSTIFRCWHSMGGVVAQKVALAYPSLLQSIVIVSSDASFKDNAGMPEFRDIVAGLSDTLSREFMDAFQRGTLVKPIDPVFYNSLVAESMKVPARVFKATINGLMDFDYTNSLRKIKMPVLIFWGDKDNLCPRADQEILLKRLPDARLLVYQNTGHALHWEEPKTFVNDLIGFLQSESCKNKTQYR